MEPATTADSGDPSPATGSSARPLPPTGPPTDSASSKRPRARRHRKRLRRPPHGLALPLRPVLRRALRGRRRRGRPRLPRRPAGRRRRAARLRAPRPRGAPRARRARRLQAEEPRGARGALSGGDRRGRAGRGHGPLRRAGSTRAACTSPTCRRSPTASARVAAPGGASASATASASLRAARSPHEAVVDGDARSAAIAAASVVAKVTRDRYMARAADHYPELELRRQRRLQHPRAPRGDLPGRASATCTAAPSPRSPTASSSSAPESRRAATIAASERSRHVLDLEQLAAGADARSRRVEADSS